MLTFLKRVAEIAFAAAALAFMVSVGLYAGSMVFSGNGKAFEGFAGGFFGAFFAFLFVRIGDFVSKLFERAGQNRAALIALQHRYVEISLILSDNINSIATWRDLVNRKPAALWINRLHRIETPRELLLPLTNVDLLNELMDLHMVLRRLDTDFDGFNRSYEKTAELLVKDGDQEGYNYRLGTMTPLADALDAFCRSHNDGLKRSLAAIRLDLDEGPIGQRIMGFMTRRHYGRDFESRRGAELEVLEAEIKQRTEENRREIERIHANVAAGLKSSA